MRACLGPPAVVLILCAAAGCGPPPSEPAAAVFTLEEATVADIEAAFESSALSCPALVRMYLDRIAAYDDDGPLLNSIITVNLARSMSRGSSRPSGPSAGRGVRCTASPSCSRTHRHRGTWPTTNGTVILRRRRGPPTDAYVTRALREAGAFILGKASLGEFAGGNSYNSVDGRTVNPYHPLRSAGGSSSGSAVAVAANLAVFSLDRHQHLGARSRLVHRHRRPAAHHRADQPRRHRAEEPQLRHRRSRWRGR